MATEPPSTCIRIRLKLLCYELMVLGSSASTVEHWTVNQGSGCSNLMQPFQSLRDFARARSISYGLSPGCRQWWTSYEFSICAIRIEFVQYCSMVECFQDKLRDVHVCIPDSELSTALL